MSRKFLIVLKYVAYVLIDVSEK